MTTVGIRMHRYQRGNQLRGVSGGCFGGDEIRFVGCNISNIKGDNIAATTSMIISKNGEITYKPDRKNNQDHRRSQVLDDGKPPHAHRVLLICSVRYLQIKARCAHVRRRKRDRIENGCSTRVVIVLTAQNDRNARGRAERSRELDRRRGQSVSFRSN